MQDGNANAVGTPPLDDFKKVKDFIARHCSIWRGLDVVDGRNIITKSVLCLLSSDGALYSAQP